jgi:hypothetical protein
VEGETVLSVDEEEEEWMINWKLENNKKNPSFL